LPTSPFLRGLLASRTAFRGTGLGPDSLITVFSCFSLLYFVSCRIYVVVQL